MLTAKQLKDIKVLQNICEEADQIALKLNWEMLRDRDPNEKTDFFFYEGEELIAFLGVYGFGSKAEICGMVKPEFRRKGIFSKLLDEALTVCKAKGYKEILLNAPAASQSAKEFLKTVECEYETTEYQMKWSPIELQFDNKVSIRASESESDLQAEIQLDIQCFNISESDAIEYNKRIRRDETQQFYIIEHEGQVVGKIRVAYEGKEAWIYGFAIFPEFQGKGIGRNALKQVVSEASKKGYDVFLDVDATNANALKLYESCGFVTIQAQDYYVTS